MLTEHQHTRPAAWLHKGSAQWLLPPHQGPKRPRAGILEKLDCSLLFPNQSCVAIRVKDWHVTLNCWPKLLHSCTSVVGRGFQWCCKACSSPPESQHELIHTAYGTWKKKPEFRCTSSILRVPAVIQGFVLLLFSSDNASVKRPHDLSEFGCCTSPQRSLLLC